MIGIDNGKIASIFGGKWKCQFQSNSGIGNGLHTWPHEGCVHVTAGSSISMDGDSPEDGLIIKWGSVEANTIKEAIDSKLQKQTNDGPDKPFSLGTAANITSKKETASPAPVANTTRDKEPMSLATPSPVTTETTQSRKRNLPDYSSDDVVPEIGSEKLEDTASRSHEQLMGHLSKICTKASDSIYWQSIGKCLVKSSDGIIIKLSSIENDKIITNSYIKVPRRQF